MSREVQNSPPAQTGRCLSDSRLFSLVLSVAQFSHFRRYFSVRRFALLAPVAPSPFPGTRISRSDSAV